MARDLFWTEERLREVMTLRRLGSSDDYIAKHFGVTKKAVRCAVSDRVNKAPCHDPTPMKGRCLTRSEEPVEAARPDARVNGHFAEELREAVARWLWHA